MVDAVIFVKNQSILSIGDVVLYVEDDILHRRGVCSREQFAII